MIILLYIFACGGTNPNENDKIKRPDNTGILSQFINLSDISLTNKNFKCEKFDFANLENCKFTKCHFDRLLFMELI